MRSWALWPTRRHSHFMSPKSSTTTTSQRPLKSSSRSPPATAGPRTGKSVTTPSAERSLHHCSLRSEKIQRAVDKLIALLKKVCCQVSRCLSVMLEQGDLFLMSVDHSLQTSEKIHVVTQKMSTTQTRSTDVVVCSTVEQRCPLESGHLKVATSAASTTAQANERQAYSCHQWFSCMIHESRHTHRVNDSALWPICTMQMEDLLECPHRFLVRVRLRITVGILPDTFSAVLLHWVSGAWSAVGTRWAATLGAISRHFLCERCWTGNVWRSRG